MSDLVDDGEYDDEIDSEAEAEFLRFMLDIRDAINQYNQLVESLPPGESISLHFLRMGQAMVDGLHQGLSGHGNNQR